MGRALSSGPPGEEEEDQDADQRNKLRHSREVNMTGRNNLPQGLSSITSEKGGVKKGASLGFRRDVEGSFWRVVLFLLPPLTASIAVLERLS